MGITVCGSCGVGFAMCMGCMVLELDVVVCVNCIVLKLLFVKGVRCVRVVMSGNCGAWELKTVSYVDGKWCVGNLVCGGFSVSNYLQGNLDWAA